VLVIMQCSSQRSVVSLEKEFCIAGVIRCLIKGKENMRTDDAHPKSFQCLVQAAHGEVVSKQEALASYLKHNYPFVMQKPLLSWFIQTRSKFNLYAMKYTLLHALLNILEKANTVDSNLNSIDNNHELKCLKQRISGYTKLLILSHCLSCMLHSFPKTSYEEGLHIADYPATDTNNPWRGGSETGGLIVKFLEIVLIRMTDLESNIRAFLESNIGAFNNLREDAFEKIFKQVIGILPDLRLTFSVDACIGELLSQDVENKPISISSCPIIEFEQDTSKSHLTISGHSSGSAVPRDSYNYKAFSSKMTITPQGIMGLFEPKSARNSECEMRSFPSINKK